MAEETEIAQKNILAGFDLPNEKKLYFNGFSIAISPADAVIVLMLNDQPIMLLNTSQTMLKSLAAYSLGIISDYENKIDQKILTTNEIQSLLGKNE